MADWCLRKSKELDEKTGRPVLIEKMKKKINECWPHGMEHEEFHGPYSSLPEKSEKNDGSAPSEKKKKKDRNIKILRCTEKDDGSFGGPYSSLSEKMLPAKKIKSHALPSLQ